MLTQTTVTIALPAIIFSHMGFARKVVRFYQELSVDSHLPSYDDSCAVWEICGKCFLLWERRNLIILYLPELSLPIDYWPDAYKHQHFFFLYL